MNEIITTVNIDDQTVDVLLKPTDTLDDIEKAIQEQFPTDLSEYIIMNKTIDGDAKQILTEDRLYKLLSNSKTLELFMEKFQPNKITNSQPSNRSIPMISISTTISLPVVQDTETMTRGHLDNKYKTFLRLKQHFDATAITTKFFLSEISLNAAGINYLKRHLIKNFMPTSVTDYIQNHLYDLANGKLIAVNNKSEIDQKSRKKNGSDEIIIKIKSNISNGQLIVVIAYATVDNGQKNVMTSFIKKMVPDRKFNKSLDHMLDEWIDEKITSEHQLTIQ